MQKKNNQKEIKNQKHATSKEPRKEGKEIHSWSCLSCFDKNITRHICCMQIKPHQKLFLFCNKSNTDQKYISKGCWCESQGKETPSFLSKVKAIKQKDKILSGVKMCLSGHLMRESIRQHHQGKQMKYEAPFCIPARKTVGMFDMLKMCLLLCWLYIGTIRKKDLSKHSFISPPFAAVFFPVSLVCFCTAGWYLSPAFVAC